MDNPYNKFLKQESVVQEEQSNNPYNQFLNAEEIKMTKIQYFDDLSSINFFGSMVAICHADRLGYLKNREKVEMISFFV